MQPKIIATKTGRVIQYGEYRLQSTYRITEGFYTGKLIKLDWISRRLTYSTASGLILGTQTTINVPLAHLSTNLGTVQNKENMIRLAAQKLLKAGNKVGALKLLKLLK
jgi:glutamate dehydrogenase/leucine dehydrogenase